MKFFLDNIELILSAAGLLVIIAVPVLFFSDRTLQWEAAAITAVIVGVLHGGIFWLVRRKQRKVRDETIADIKMMLKDIVNNQLTIITLSSSKLDAKMVDNVSDSIGKISTLINSLSEESLVSWRGKYEQTLNELHNATGK